MDVQKNTADSKPRESKRHCKHNHGRRKASIEELVSPQSHIYEESNGVDILKLDDRPATSSSGKKSVLLSMSPRPASRPSTTRSAFEHIPGTRPASRRNGTESGGTYLRTAADKRLKQTSVSSADALDISYKYHQVGHKKFVETISRSSNRSRRSRPDSTRSHILNKGQNSDSDSDHDDGRIAGFEPDFQTVDISDEKAFDTDLEVEASPKLPHFVDGVLDFQSLRLAYCEQAALLKANYADLSRQ